MDNAKEKGNDFEQKKQLFLRQKELLDTFLQKGAISKVQYDKSYGDLVRLMGMESVAEQFQKTKEEKTW